MNDPNHPQFWHEFVLTTARNEASIQAQIDLAEQMRERMYKLYVQHYDEKIQQLQAELSDTQQNLIAAAKEHALNTGKFDLHPSIRIKRKPVAYMYDPEQVLREADERSEYRLIRVKKELDKRQLTSLLNAGQLPWVQAEPINDISVTLAPLGEWLIIENPETPHG